MKKIIGIALVLAAAVFLGSCRSAVETDVNVSPEEVADKTYVWEKEGFGGRFAIVLYGDGTYEYYEGPLSSYIGAGTWRLEKGIVTLTEGEGGYDLVFRFAVRSGELAFISEGSDQFLYTRVEDGDRFLPSEKTGLFA